MARISVENESLGNIPTSSSDLSSADDTVKIHRAKETLHSVEDIQFLVLDDDPAICRLIQSALNQPDYRLDSVSEASKIEEKLRLNSYHVIIADYHIPGVDFEQISNWIHEFQPEASVIVVTGFPSVDSALNCLRARIYDYITKPFPLEKLQRVVTNCLESRGLLRMTEQALREAVGLTIREKRKSLGLTLAQTAQRTNMSVGYLSQIELGKNSASVETLYRLSLALGIKMGDLFQGVKIPF